MKQEGKKWIGFSLREKSSVSSIDFANRLFLMKTLHAIRASTGKPKLKTLLEAWSQ